MSGWGVRPGMVEACTGLSGGVAGATNGSDLSRLGGAASGVPGGAILSGELAVTPGGQAGADDSGA